MKIFNRLFEYLRTVVKAIFHVWIDALRELICELIQRRRLTKARRDLPGRLEKAAPSSCVPISDPALKRPDPMIYSQLYLMSQGLAVTWNNPDIMLERGGVLVSSDDLLPDTEYDIVARIWNGSTEAPVVGLPVTFSFLGFGVGTVSNFIGRTYVNLGVKGGINHPAFARMKWRTPAQAGHYCLRAAFEWLDDLNPYNNLGQENTTVAEAHSPAVLTFILRNDDRERQLFRFEVDTYAFPPRPNCDQQQHPRERVEGQDLELLRTRPGAIHQVPPEHDRQNYRLPPDWMVVFDPETVVLAYDQSVSITVTITPPKGFTGSKMLNIHAFHGHSLVGGVTVEVKRV